MITIIVGMYVGPEAVVVVHMETRASDSQPFKVSSLMKVDLLYSLLKEWLFLMCILGAYYPYDEMAK